MPSPLYCWIDLETSGLNPRLDHILEVSVVVTDTDLVELACLAMIVNPALGRHGQGWADRLDDKTKAMHTSSGLLREITYAPSLAHVDEAMVAILKPMATEEKYILAGHRPSFAHPFIKEGMPGLAARISDSYLDVISARRLIRDLAQRPDLIPDIAVTGRAHRAMSDVQDAITEMRIYAQYLSLIPRWA